MEQSINNVNAQSNISPLSISLSHTINTLKSHKTLPSKWWRNANVFELEKRAIFSKVWLLVSHTSRFKKPGDYISGNYVFDYFIIQDKDNTFRAFHNVCRHRAFPVVTKSTGSSVVVGCKYHGWSYNTKGDLVKAPQFDSIPDFNKSANGLFKIHTHVTPEGFIFLNFSASSEPLISFNEYLPELSTEWQKIKFDHYEYCYSWQVTGSYNWKTLMDGYQECYHCSISHPGFAKELNLNQYHVTPLTNAARHEVSNAKMEKEESLPPSFTFLFPTNGVTVTEKMWYTMRVVPIDAKTTRMEYDVYRHESLPEHDLREFMKFYEQVEKEDFELCQATQRNLNAGIYSQGYLHPNRENGVLFYQNRVLDFCSEHMEEETRLKREIYPAQPVSQRDDPASCLATRICSEVGNEYSPLAW